MSSSSKKKCTPPIKMGWRVKQWVQEPLGVTYQLKAKKKKKTELRYSNVDNIGKPKSIDYEMFGWTQ